MPVSMGFPRHSSILTAFLNNARELIRDARRHKQAYTVAKAHDGWS
jgi:hypothetical protein